MCADAPGCNDATRINRIAHTDISLCSDCIGVHSLHMGNVVSSAVRALKVEIPFHRQSTISAHKLREAAGAIAHAHREYGRHISERVARCPGVIGTAEPIGCQRIRISAIATRLASASPKGCGAPVEGSVMAPRIYTSPEISHAGGAHPAGVLDNATT